MVSKVILRLSLPLLCILIQLSLLNAQSFWERDVDFGNGGTARVGGGREQESLRSLALLPNGKILAAGRYGDSLSFVLARYLPGGQLDASFGINGKFGYHLSNHRGEAKEIIVQPDGRFIIGATGENALGYKVFGLVRFLGDGLPDITYGSGGVAKSNSTPGLSDKLNAIARQPDGKIVAAGSTNLNDGADDQQSVTLCRFNVNGSVDNSFGTNGLVRLPFPAQHFEFNALAFQPDGSIVAAGSNSDKIIVARFLSDGSIDSTFGTNGVRFLQYSAAGKTRCRAVAILPDGNILLGAWCWEYWLNNGAIAIRLLSDGSLDPTFHNGGMSFIHCNYQLNTTSMALQSDGKIVLAATGLNHDAAPATGMFRYHPNGAPDSSFAQNGAWVNLLGSENSGLYAVYATPDGKILAGGVAKKQLDFDFALLRLLNDGMPDPFFGENGLVCTDFGWGSDWAGSIHARPGGKVLLASNADGSAGNLILQRKCILDQFLPNGTPDFGFGNNGRDSFPGGDLKTAAFQPDGKILVGTDGFWDGNATPASLFRRLPQGGADSAFGHFGRVDSLFGPYNSPAILQAGVLSNGKIVVAGSVNRPGTFRDFILACLNADGSRDSTFGDNGFVVVDFNNKNDEVYGLSVQADDKILLGGTAWNGAVAKKDVVLMRFLPNGVPDNTWGQNGILLDDFEAAADENISYMAIAPNQKLLLAVQRQLTVDVFENADFDNVLALYNTNGTRDLSFGAGGRVIVPVEGADAGNRYIRQIQFLASGKFMTAETRLLASMDPDSFSIEMKRYLPDGAVDTLPEAQTVISDSWGKAFRGLAIAMLPTEGIVWIAGSNLFEFQLNEDIVLARYRTEPGCLPLSVHTVSGKRLAAAAVSILPSAPGLSCPANTVTTQCADEILCLCGKDSTFIVPYKNDDPLNGVSTYDMVLISRHILGLEPLNSPYKIIAADVNLSKSVTTFDIVEIRKLILGIYQSFPATNSWRFVRKNHVFSNPANPFAQPFPEHDTVFVFEPAARSAFLAIKTGDVNETYVSGCSNVAEPEPRQSIALNAALCPMEAGELTRIPIAFAEDARCVAWQAAFRFDPSALELVAAEPGELAGMDAANFGLTEAEHGSIRVLWQSEALREQPMEPGKTLFRLVFRAKKNIGAGEPFLSTDESALACRAYRDNGEPVKLSFSEPVRPCTVPATTGIRVMPNPVGASLCFVLDGEAQQQGELNIYNAAGSICFRQTVAWSGSPDHCISEVAAWSPGLYTWQFRSYQGSSSEGKFLKQ